MSIYFNGCAWNSIIEHSLYCNLGEISVSVQVYCQSGEKSILEPHAGLFKEQGKFTKQAGNS